MCSDATGKVYRWKVNHEDIPERLNRADCLPGDVPL